MAASGMTWAQGQDVTSQYLTNADFDEGTIITTAVCTYAKDIDKNSADGASLMTVTSWTPVDQNDQKAGGLFHFGTKAWLATNTALVPDTNSDGEAIGTALGIAGCWGGNAYYTQDLTKNLTPGTYTIEICAYNAFNKTNFGSQMFGIKEANGTEHFVTTTWTSNSWTKASLSFTIDTETAATFYVGAKNIDGGSDASAKLFIDYVKIYKEKSLQEIMDEATEESPSDVTKYYIQNAAVTSTAGWTNGRINQDQQYTGAPDKIYMDTWNDTRNQYQVVTLKPGKYRLKAATRAIATITTANIYANVEGWSNNSTAITAVGNSGGELGNGWGWTTVDFDVMQTSKVTIGFYSECGNNKWAGADDFSLLFLRNHTPEEYYPILATALKNFPDRSDAFGTEFTYGQEAKAIYDARTAGQDEVVGKAKGMLGEYRTYIKNIADAYPTVAAVKDARNADAWEFTTAPTNKGNLANNGNMDINGNTMRENWKAGGLLEGDMKQVVKNLPNGKYFLRMASFTRQSINEKDYIYIKSGDATATALSLGDAANKNGFVNITDPVEVTNGEVEIGLHIGSGSDWAAIGGVVLYAYDIDVYTRSTETDKFGTICLPYSVASINGAKVYNATINNNYVELTEVESMEAGKPYIYQATADEQTFLYGKSNILDVPVANAPLTGVFTETAVPVGSYVLQKKDKEQMFYIVEEGAQPTLSANKAYLTAPEAGVKALAFADNTTTAIKAVEALTNGKALIYDLNGRQQKTLQKGVNIVNGVKVLVK